MLIGAKSNLLRIVLIKISWIFCDITHVLKKARFWQNSNWRFTPSKFLFVVIHSNHQDQQWSLSFKFNCTKQVSHLESITCSKKFECSNNFLFSSRTLNVWKLCSFILSFIFLWLCVILNLCVQITFIFLCFFLL
jgi:hypothetical protein